MTSTDLDNAFRAACDHLLAERTPAGHWEGHLSSSALSTATAVWALHVAQRDRGPGPFSALIQPGLDWLARHQNHDGGWGDTVLSASNLSTSLLAWSALAASDGRDAHRRAVARAEAYLTREAGGLQPDRLADAVAAAYGRDQTFSVPILMMAAQASRLGPAPQAWRHVRALPFELAALPPSWWNRLRLPVVSYALPALVAVGQARFRQAPPRCPVRRLVRRAAVGPTLRRLESLQPADGGFLEATPLTSFITMALAAAGQIHGDVAARCIDFLARSVRHDGAWPIDTNLATWVTTLATNALAADAQAFGALDDADRRRLADWLLDQQHRQTHPYTQAAPGGWAWTNLPGGVPDADDTAGAVLALAHLAPHDDRAAVAAAEGVRWLLDLQNRDGGIPTFCRGWGHLPFDQSSADLTAHALAAWTAWRNRLPVALADRVDRATDRALAYLARAQRSDGAWLPLWFGNEHAPDHASPTYGTARVVAALAHAMTPSADASAAGTARHGEAGGCMARPACLAGGEGPACTGRASPKGPAARIADVAAMAERGIAWLLSAQDAGGGWGGDAGLQPSIEETALATTALATAAAVGRPDLADPARRGAAYLVARTRGGTAFEPAPIGFYFARLWYFERLYPVIFTVSALGRVRALGEGRQP